MVIVDVAFVLSRKSVNAFCTSGFLSHESFLLSLHINSSCSIYVLLASSCFIHVSTIAASFVFASLLKYFARRICMLLSELPFLINAITKQLIRLEILPLRSEEHTSELQSQFHLV